MFLNNHKMYVYLVNITLLFMSLMVASAAFAKAQVITPSVTEFAVSQNENISFDVIYQTQNPIDETLTGIGLRLHFDSSKVSLLQLNNVYTPHLLLEGAIESDDGNFDNDEATDKMVNVAWLDFQGNFPGEGNTPTMLYSAEFTIAANYGGSSQINFSASGTANGYILETMSVTLTRSNNQPPVFETVTDLTVEATGILTAISLPVPVVNDVEDGVLTPTPSNNGPFGLGVTTIEWTVTDSGNNQVAINQDIEVIDTTPPQLNAPAAISVQSSNGAPVTVNLPKVYGYDLVDQELEAQPDKTGPFAVGETIVRWTVTDTRNNAASVDQTIRVSLADVPPTIETVADITMEATGELTAVTLTPPNASDQEDGMLTPEPDNQGPFGLGITVVTWTVTDSAQQSASTTQNVTIEDTTKPVISVPDDQSVEATANLTPIILGQATAVDLVTESVEVFASDSGPFAVGVHTITWMATDDHQNTATATSEVEITDNTPPNLTKPINITLESTTGEPIEVDLPSVIGYDLVDGDVVAVANHTGPFGPGETVVRWTATDVADNSTQVEHIITVTTPDALPTIAIAADITKEATGVLTAVDLVPPVANDQEDGVLIPEPSDEGPFGFGPTTVTWSVTDSAGQTVFSTQLITIEDTTAPMIAEIDEQQVEATGPTTAVVLNIPSVTDLVDQNVQVNTTATGPWAVGGHHIDWQATDTQGNTATSSSTLAIIDSTAPVFVEPPNAITVVSVDGAAMSIELPSVVAIDLVDGELVAQVDNSGPFELGEHLITWTVEDNADNSAMIEQLIHIVVDNTSPLITAPANISMEATGFTTDVVLGEPVVSDDFDQQVEVSNDNSGPFTFGEHIVTWTAIDDSGNQSTAVQTVVIDDETAPVFTQLPEVTIEAQGLNTLITEVKLGQVTAVDLVDGLIEANLVELYLLQSGRHQVEWSVVDQQDNRATAVQNLNILPLVNLAQQQLAGAGSIVSLPVSLSGDAPSYPVTVQLALTGELVDEQVVAAQMIVEIVTGRDGAAVFTLPESLELDGNEVITVQISGVENGALGDISQTTIRLINNNQPPMVSLTSSQNGLNGVVFARNEGLIVVRAQVTDVNANDTHSIDWQLPDGIVDEVLDSDSLTVELNPQNINGQQFSVMVTATEQTSAELAVSLSLAVILVDNAPILAAVDSDGDGINDDQEGLNDSDGDGIADYLDNDSSTHRLPIGDDHAPLETLPGLSLQIGQTSAASQGYQVSGAGLSTEQLQQYGDGGEPVDISDVEYQAVSPIVDFIIAGLAEPGIAVPIVIPLAADTDLPQNAKYRKFDPLSGWVTFVPTQGNEMASAPRNIEGNCPSVTDESYQSGLNAGDHCIKLTIVDGGIYDSDQQANGYIVDPGVISAENLKPVAIIADVTDFYETEQVSLNAGDSYDPEGLSIDYQWQQIAGSQVQITNDSSSILSFVAPMVGQDEYLTFTLTVNDGTHDSLVAERLVLIKRNQIPIAVASASQVSVEADVTVTLSGSDSIDEEGLDLTYDWLQISGEPVTLSASFGEQVTFVAPTLSQSSTLIFELVVNDGLRNSEAVQVSVMVNKHQTTPTPPSSDTGGGGGSLWLIWLLMPLCRIKRKRI